MSRWDTPRFTRVGNLGPRRLDSGLGNQVRTERGFALFDGGGGFGGSGDLEWGAANGLEWGAGNTISWG
jgi:hypothetical protein